MTTLDEPWDASGSDAEWSASTLDAAMDPVSQWEPVRGADGAIIDFTFLSANTRGFRLFSDRNTTVGTRLSSLLAPMDWSSLRDSLAGAYDRREHIARQWKLTDRTDPTVTRTFQIVTIPIGSSLVIWARDIDAESRRSEVLAKTVHALGSTTRLANVGSFYVDLRTGNLECSPEYLRLIGVGEDDPQPTVADLVEMTHPDDRQHADRIAEILRSGRSSRERFTARLRARNGRERLLVGTMSYEFDADGLPVRAHGAVQDMSEIVAIESQAREHRDFLEAVLDTAPSAIFVKDTDGRFVLVNKAYAGLFNRTPTELMGLTNRELFDDELPTEDLERWDAEDEFVLTSLREVAVESRFDDLVGRSHRFRVRKSPLVLADGTVHLLGVLTDITGETDARDRLRASEARFRAALFGSPISTAVIDWNAGRFTAVNQAYEDFLGYTAEEIVTMTAADFLALVTFPDDQVVAEDFIRDLRGDHAFDKRIERRYRHRDGTARWGIISTSIVRDSEGNPEQVISQVVDVTERHEAEARVRESEALVRALVRHSTDVVTVFGDQGRIRYVSPAVEDILGYRPEAYPITGMTELVHPDDRAVWDEHVGGAVLNTDQTHRAEVRVRNAAGDWVWIESTVFNLLDDDNVRGIVNHFRDITERHVAEATLAHRAMHDALTGLPNRLLLIDRLQHALTRTRRSDRVSVAFLDIDRFKVVNDSLGHASGDQLLVAVAERLQTMVRPSDTVARLGGDEFVVCCEDIGEDSEALEVVERILIGMREPFRLDGRDAHLTVSIGVALGEPGASPETLLRDADAAMYVAKGNGRDRFDVFNADVRARVLWRMEVEHDIHDALDHDQFVVHYQPIIDLNSGTVAGAEALVRWNHPTRGTLEPQEFIPVAEETGVIDQVGEWVLGEASAQLRRWLDQGRSEIATLWVNLSAHQLGRADLAARLERIVRDRGVEPTSIGLEITESVLMAEHAMSSATLEQLEQLGFKLAIDDFGTGYSSLSYLQRLHLDVLKIDRSFVTGLTENEGDRSIVTAVIGLAHRLGIAVSAEGVETREQLEELRALECDTACGFLIARPGPPDAVEALLDERPKW